MIATTETTPSNRLASLINLAKLASNRDEAFTVSGVAAALEWEFCGGMRLQAVMHHLVAAMEEATRDPRYRISHESTTSLLLAPLTGLCAIEQFGLATLESTYTVEQFYTAMIRHILNALACTKIDWCREALDAQRRAANDWQVRHLGRGVIDADSGNFINE